MPSVGAVTSNLTITAQNASYAAKANDFVLMDASSASVNVTLPTNPPTNTLVAVKKTDTSANYVSVVPGGVNTIDGDSVVNLAASGASATVQFDGSVWRLLSTGLTSSASSSPASGGSVYQPWSFSTASTGRYYTQPFAYGNMSLTGMGSTNTIFWPIRVPNACSILSISVYGASNTSSTNYLALYTDNPLTSSGGPAVRVLGGQVNTTGSAALVSVTGAYAVGASATMWLSFSASNTSQTFHTLLNTWLTNMPLAIGSNLALVRSTTTYTAGSPTASDVSSVPTTATNVAVPLVFFGIQ